MSTVYLNIAKLEVEKCKESFRVLFCDFLNKVATYQLLYYKIQKRDEPGFIVQDSPDTKLVCLAASSYLRNLPHGFAKCLFHLNNNSLVECYKKGHN